MATPKRKPAKRATITLMVVGLLAMLFVIVSAYITLARHDRASSVQLDHAENLDGAIDSINDLVRSLMVQQFVDADGNRFGGNHTATVRGQFEDIAGSGGSRFMGALEPFYDYAGMTQTPPQLLTPFNLRQFVTSTGPKDGTAPSWPVPGLIAETLPGVSLREIVATVAFDLNHGFFDGSADDGDWAQLARRPFMDASGNGIPDSSFGHLGNLHELVNAAFGRIVRSPNVNPFLPPLPPDTTEWWQHWQRFYQFARFEVAVKVVPHGGMIAVDSYQDPLGSSGNNGNIGLQPFNRRFVFEMLRWVKHPDDLRSRLLRGPGDPLFNEIFLDRRAIEPLLRRRGGLASWTGGSDPSNRVNARIPDVLRNLEDSWPNTFVSYFGRDADETAGGQRVNIAPTSDGGDGIGAWADGVRLDPQVLDFQAYDRRHLFTSISTSDELARKMTVRPEPPPQPPPPSPQYDPLGTLPGQLKFFLGKIANANDSVSAFDPNTGIYWIDPNTGFPVGDRYVEELADLFYDMLSGHSGWQPEPGDPPPPTLTEAVTRQEQAFMLAVNTVAFAAPRGANGFIDVVAYTDSVLKRADGDGQTYIGYAPQPFITQAMMHDDQNSADPPNNGRIALGLELYNPNEPTDPALGPDEQALDLTQFAISFAGADPNNEPSGTTWEVLSTLTNILPMPGRSTLTLAFHPAGGNPTFDSVADGIFEIEVPAFDINGAFVDVKIQLWRVGSITGWVVVDDFTVDWDESGETLPTFGDDNKWAISTYRDMTDDLHFQPADGSQRARWGAAVAESRAEAEINGVNGNDGVPDDINEITDVDPVDYPRFAPAPPLYTMNAGIAADELLFHNGDVRPTSFPTPGFMLFVPRFSHTIAETVTTVLSDQWQAQLAADLLRNPPPGPPDINLSINQFPADFGHMPIFDDHQEPFDPGYFRGTDRLPWGLLVFDYVTNIDPQRIPGGDPLRVPGRININAAPWYVLAGLPVIVPKASFGGELPIAPQPAFSSKPSPAFWSPNAGVLIGLTRFDKDILQPSGNISNTVWRRLGGDLAVAAVSYRDRAAYRDPINDPTDTYRFAHNRNGIDMTFGGDPRAIYRGDVYGAVRREDSPSKLFGFTSVGELLNVKGFDTAIAFNGNDGALLTTLSEVLHPSPTDLAPDFMKAVSLMALLDTQFLTTRSNTFTIYVTVFDRENPQASVRSQMTVDRGNTLPKLADWFNPNPPPGAFEQTTIDSTALPEIIAERRIGYFNTVFDD